jgi:gamma-glutamylcyclotransferase (GGCT)/AIG2-like uncharacterized protein YtfP
MHQEKLFCYGTIRYASVQLALFGRELTGKPDILPGFSLSKIKITDLNVVETSNEAEHPIITFTGSLDDQVYGTVFDINQDELMKADSYETDDYRRIQVQLESGITAWVYVDAKSTYQGVK